LAELIYYYRILNLEGDIIEIKIWGVKKSIDFPHGLKYSLVYINKNKRLLGYDNERMKGDHKHYFNKQIKYNFIDIDKLRDDFEKDVKELRRKLYGN